jgi:cardiolipin synthase
LDGYLARTYKQMTKLGQILDPIADKVLIVTTILFVVGFQKVSQLTIIPACIILAREVIVSGIRNLTVEQNEDFVPSNSAKWKTAIQMLSLAFILLADVFPNNNSLIITVGEILLWISAIIAVHSGAMYFLVYLTKLVDKTE